MKQYLILLLAFLILGTLSCSAPEKGKANQCLLKFLSSRLDVKKNSITIISGQTSPIKQIQVSGVSINTLLKKLNLR